jgi:hypothetical protein
MSGRLDRAVTSIRWRWTVRAGAASGAR